MEQLPRNACRSPRTVRCNTSSRSSLPRFHGVFAPNSHRRVPVVPGRCNGNKAKASETSTVFAAPGYRIMHSLR
jgi:hypothetical protein